MDQTDRFQLHILPPILLLYKEHCATFFTSSAMLTPCVSGREVTPASDEDEDETRTRTLTVDPLTKYHRSASAVWATADAEPLSPSCCEDI